MEDPTQLINQARELAYRMAGQDVSAALSETAPTRAAYKSAKATADAFEATLRMLSAGGIDALQAAAHGWAVNCFGVGVVADHRERGCRFVEEALELAQAIGCTAADGHALVDYVFNRKPGKIPQEVGGVMMTLAVLAHELGVSLRAAMHAEHLSNIARTEAIRAKQASKVHPGPLPGRAPKADEQATTAYVDCGNCPQISTGCRAGHCLRAVSAAAPIDCREQARQFLIDVRANAFRVHDDDLIEPLAALIRRAEDARAQALRDAQRACVELWDLRDDERARIAASKCADAIGRLEGASADQEGNRNG